MNQAPATPTSSRPIIQSPTPVFRNFCYKMYLSYMDAYKTQATSKAYNLMMAKLYKSRYDKMNI